jgi:hypothetical protein
LGQAKEASHHLDTGAIAAAAGGRASVGSDAVPTTLAAILFSLVVNVFGDAAVRLFEGQIDNDLDVGTVTGAVVAATHEVLNKLEDSPAEPDATRRLRGAIAKGVMPASVIEPTFVRVAEDFVGLVHLFEAFGGFLIARVAIRMVLQREFAEGPVDFLGCGVTAHAEHFVIIALRGHQRLVA